MVLAGVGLGWWFAQPRGLPVPGADVQAPRAAEPSTGEPPTRSPAPSPVAAGPAQAAVDPVAAVAASPLSSSSQAPALEASPPQSEGPTPVSNEAAAPPPAETAPKVASWVSPESSGVPEPVRRLQAESEAIFTGQPGKFTLQLVAMPGPQWQALAAAIQQVRGQLGEQTRVMTNDRLYGGVHYHAIYVGVYDSRLQAQAALQNLPPSLRSQKPMVRQFDRIAEEPRP